MPMQSKGLCTLPMLQEQIEAVKVVKRHEDDTAIEAKVRSQVPLLGQLSGSIKSAMVELRLRIKKQLVYKAKKEKSYMASKRAQEHAQKRTRRRRRKPTGPRRPIICSRSS